LAKISGETNGIVIWLRLSDAKLFADDCTKWKRLRWTKMRPQMRLHAAE
jgi:hypothetical protein